MRQAVPEEDADDFNAHLSGTTTHATPLTTRLASLFGGPLMRCAFSMGRLATGTRNLPLLLWIHSGKSTTPSYSLFYYELWHSSRIAS